MKVKRHIIVALISGIGFVFIFISRELFSNNELDKTAILSAIFGGISFSIAYAVVSVLIIIIGNRPHQISRDKSQEETSFDKSSKEANGGKWGEGDFPVEHLVPVKFLYKLPWGAIVWLSVFMLPVGIGCLIVGIQNISTPIIITGIVDLLIWIGGFWIMAYYSILGPRQFVLKFDSILIPSFPKQELKEHQLSELQIVHFIQNESIKLILEGGKEIYIRKKWFKNESQFLYFENIVMTLMKRKGIEIKRG